VISRDLASFFKTVLLDHRGPTHQFAHHVTGDSSKIPLGPLCDDDNADHDPIVHLSGVLFKNGHYRQRAPNVSVPRTVVACLRFIQLALLLIRPCPQSIRSPLVWWRSGRSVSGSCAPPLRFLPASLRHRRQHPSGWPASGATFAGQDLIVLAHRVGFDRSKCSRPSHPQPCSSGLSLRGRIDRGRSQLQCLGVPKALHPVI